MPSLLGLRSKLVRLYPQLGTRAMAGLQGALSSSSSSSSSGGGVGSSGVLPGVAMASSGWVLDDDSLPLPLWRADEPGSAAGDSAGAVLPPDSRGQVPSSAGALYVRSEHPLLTPDHEAYWADLYATAWSSVRDEATAELGYNLTDKQRRRISDKLAQREKDLVVEATSVQDLAEVLLTVYTEQREGQWRVRRPVSVGITDQIALEIPSALDSWSVHIDSAGILARNKLRSMIELSATRMNVRCPSCSAHQPHSTPHDSDEEEDGGAGYHDDDADADENRSPDTARAAAHDALSGTAQEACSVCTGLRAVEMSFVITVTLRVASFLSLSLPSSSLVGEPGPHLRLQPPSAERTTFLRSRAIDGAINAAAKVGKQHWHLHRAKLLSVCATVRRTRSVSIQVHSSKAKSTRTFDHIDPWPELAVPPGADPNTEAYLPQRSFVSDTLPLVARARALQFLQDAGVHLSPTTPIGGQGTLATSAGSGNGNGTARAQGSYFPPMPSSTSIGSTSTASGGAGAGISSTKKWKSQFRARSRSRGSPSLRSYPTSPNPPPRLPSSTSPAVRPSTSPAATTGSPAATVGSPAATVGSSASERGLIGGSSAIGNGGLAPPSPQHISRTASLSPRRGLRDLFASR